jgi:hypothetical protein
LSRPAPVSLVKEGDERLCNIIDPERLVVIDETWIKTNTTPLRGWGPKGKRAADLCATWSLAHADRA